MPLVTINVIENVFSEEQKREMIDKVTDAMVSIEGEAMRGITWVLIEEIREGHWGIGGEGVVRPRT
ncbi:MAG: 4-oxalocrotonate tautomerase family protein [Nitrosomonadales bacterium]|nr:4-oxalocrotonate tautomerase family protein [Nitrosomonadales bacterium]